MSSFHNRPRFEQIVHLAPDEFEKKILSRVETDDPHFEVKHHDGFICLRIPEGDRHFWSPRLNISFEATEDGETKVDGLYGPNANVWGLFLYAYLTTGSAAIFSGVLAFSQWFIGSKNPWGFWIFVPAVLGLVTLYVIAQVGQKLGAQQTFRLHQTYESAVEETVEIR